MRTNKEIFSSIADRVYVKLTNDLQRKPKATKKDLIKLVVAKLNENYSEVQQTKLYNNHSTEYCRSLEFLQEYFNN